MRLQDVEIACAVRDAGMVARLLEAWEVTDKPLPDYFSLHRQAERMILCAHGGGMIVRQIVSIQDIYQAEAIRIVGYSEVLFSAVQAMAHAFSCRAGEVPTVQPAGWGMVPMMKPEEREDR